MGCLDNIIGVRGCDSGSALYYINDLPGINVADFDKAINAEKQNAKIALLEKIDFATKLLVQRINTHFEGKYQLKSFVENETVGYYLDNKVIKAAQEGYLTGYEVKIDNTAHLSFELQSISLFCNHSGDVDVKVYDLLQGKLLDTITITAVAGEIVTVNALDKVYPTHKQRLHLLICYESAFESYATNWSQPYVVKDNCETCSGTAGNKYIYFRSAKVPSTGPFIRSSLTGNTVSGGAGLSINYSLNCTFDEYLCSIRSKLALPLLYLAGEQIMKEMKHSKRLTGVVTIYGTNHAELMQEYQNEYLKEMEDLLMSAEIPSGICFSCKPKVRTSVTLP